MAFNADQSAYKALRGATSERTKRVVAWTGAALSVPAGVPSWTRLRELLTEELQRKAQTLKDADRATHVRYAENAARAQSPWDAFKILRKGLGDTTYAATIREALRPAHNAVPPSAYEKLWELNLQGIINLNIDKIASRAFANVYGGTRASSEFSSRTVGSHTRALSNPHSAFIYNAHGTEDDLASWVFTKDDLNELLSTPAYVNFINTVLSAYTVVFVGISADDRAAGGHLERLGDLGVQTGDYYWITDRVDLETDRWAEKRGIRVIRY